MLYHCFGLCLATLMAQAEVVNTPRDVVWLTMNAIVDQHWQGARQYFTKEAYVVGVPAEEPEKRWTKSAADFLVEKPKWCFRILDSRLQEHDRTATMLVDFRHAHLVCRSTFELVKIGKDWKIDAMRIATRRDAPGAAEQMKKLKGTWVFVPSKEQKQSCLLRGMTLQLDQDDFKMEMTLWQIQLFSSKPPEDRNVEYRGWQVRLYPKAKDWLIEFQWEAGQSMEGLLAQVSFEGDKLVLLPIRLGTVDTVDQTPTDRWVFEKK